jgi:hypothetical protein
MSRAAQFKVVLAGWQGYYIAWHQAFYTVTCYAKGHQLQGITKRGADPGLVFGFQNLGALN